MSHWRKFESKVLDNVDRTLLGRAFRNLGVEMDENIKSINNSWGSDTVDAGLRKNGENLSLGVKLTKNENGGESVELTGDFYCTGLNESTFIDQLAQQYQKENVIQKCEDQRWTIDEDSITVDKDGNIVIDAYQYA